MSFFKSFFWMIFLNILILITVSIVGTFVIQALGIKGQWGMYIVFYSIFGFGGAFISLLLSRVFAKKFMGVKVIDPRTAQGQEKLLVNLVYQMASRARLPKPEVGVFESEQANAFATGPSKNKSLIAVSSSLLHATSEQELEGVIAHEIAHIANGDMVTMTLLQGLINTMVLLAARLVTNLILSNQKNRSFWLEFFIFQALQVFFSLLGSIALSYFSKIREYSADKGGAKLSSTNNMIAALEFLKRTIYTQATPERANKQAKSYAYLQISGKSKNKKSWLSNALSTHPPLENRIARLKNLHS